MTNYYAELPALEYQRTSVPMTEVIACLMMMPRAIEVKRAAYIMFRIESENGERGINNNYAGIQADSGRWPAQFDACFSGTVTEAENGTGKTRIFLAFRDWRASLEMLCDRVEARGLYVGGATHLILTPAIAAHIGFVLPIEGDRDLARAYHKEWAAGNAYVEPTSAEIGNFRSMYSRAAALFRNGAAAKPAPASPPPPAAPEESAADKLMDAELAKINQGDPT